MSLSRSVFFAVSFFVASGCKTGCEEGFVAVQSGECLEDADGDGVTANDDCDDNDADRSPAAEDLLGDDIDQNCDGVDGVDLDGDGEPSLASGGRDCDDGNDEDQGKDADEDGWPWCLDCDDGDPRVSPGAIDECDGLDQNCDGYVDVDVDGVGSCALDATVSGLVDILFIVDNSCSMFEEQNALAASASNLVQPFLERGTDFQIGVVTTDMTDFMQSGRLVDVGGLKWVDQNTPDPIPTMAMMFVLGTTGSATEQGLDAATAAVSLSGPGSHNEGFIRESADLAMVVLSDEEDQSYRLTVQEFIDWANVLKNGPVVSFHSIVSPALPCPGAATPGLRYIELTNALGGVVGSICDADYSPILDEIAEGYGAAPSESFELPYAVDPSSLAATVTAPDGTVVAYVAADLTWDPVTFSVSLPLVPEIASTVVIWYAPAIASTP